MAHCKDGQFWNQNPQRALANNSVAYTEKPDAERFLEEWLSLVRSKSGERGIFNRESARFIASLNGRRDPNKDFGTNPCCFSGDMMLLTSEGYKRFEDLDGTEFNIVNSNGDLTRGTVWKVGGKEVVEVVFEPKLNKKPIVCTGDHVFQLNDGTECMAKDLVGKRLMPYVECSNDNNVANNGPHVIDVRKIGVKEVYDFNEPATSWGVVEGVVVHNSEIILQPKEFCNLTEIVVREYDTIDSLKEKARYAAILGCLQSTLTDYGFIGREWKRNSEEERLLGVSMTGLCDHHILGHKSIEAELMLRELKQVVIDTAREWSEILGINMPAATTCVKPSGCRPWDAITITTDGILTLEEMLVDHKHGDEWSDYEGSVITGKHDVSDICKTYVNGESDVIRINLNYGVSLDSTKNHKWFVSGFKKGRDIVPVNKWVRADEIKPGHIIDHSIGLYRKEDSSVLKHFDPESIHVRNDTVVVRQPEVVDERLAWLLGYLWGDGAMSPSKFRLRFIDEYKYNIEKVKDIIFEKFGIDCKINKPSGNRKAYCLEVSSKYLWHWLIKNNVWKYYNDNIDVIPEVIRRSSWKDIIAFIAGMYDADGWCGSDGRQTFTTSSEMFSRHFQHVAMSVGLIFGRSKNVVGNNFQSKKEMYLMSVACGCDHDAFEVFKVNSNKMLNIGNEDTCWNGLKDRKYVFGVVVGSEYIGKQKTYDIETKCHWYMNGAFKSHNTVSQLVNCASGLHPRYSPYYIRRVRVSTSDPICQFLVDKGVKYDPEVGETLENASTYVFSFPCKSPENAVMRDERCAIKQLEYWKMIQECWCEHKPSITIYVKDEEWLEVGAWVYKNWNYVSGISFLPYDGGVYPLAPYEEIDEEQYESMVKEMPDLDFSELPKYEKDDQTEGAREFACTGGSCELI